MKTFYSILYIGTNPQFEEKIGIGLLCVNGNDVFYRYSKDKLAIIAKLLPKASHTLINSHLKSFELRVPILDSSGQKSLFNTDASKNLFSEAYFNYLNKYNNNLIQFSKPETIDIDVTSEIFEKLFKTFIFEQERFNEGFKRTKSSELELFKARFITSVQPYANTNYEVTSEIIKNLVTPVKVDLFGKNDIYVSAQTIDFTKTKAHLSNDITSYLYLALSSQARDMKAKCFLIGEEPDKQMTFNHSLWDEVRKTDLIQYISTDESDVVLDYLKNHGVEPVQ